MQLPQNDKASDSPGSLIISHCGFSHCGFWTCCKSTRMHFAGHFQDQKGAMFGLGITGSTCIDQIPIAGLSFPHFQEYDYRNLPIQFKVAETRLICLRLTALPAVTVPCPWIHILLLCQKLWDLTMV